MTRVSDPAVSIMTARQTGLHGGTAKRFGGGIARVSGTVDADIGVISICDHARTRYSGRDSVRVERGTVGRLIVATVIAGSWQLSDIKTDHRRSIRPADIILT